MKPALKLILIVVLYAAILLQIPNSTKAHNINKKWAVLISGFPGPLVDENYDNLNNMADITIIIDQFGWEK